MVRKDEFVNSHSYSFLVPCDRRLLVGCLLMVAFAMTGCQSTGSAELNVVNAVDLPLAYRAVDRSAAPPVDLSVLARRSLDSDLIYAGDVLDVTMVTGAETETPEPLTFTVSPRGTIELPLIGDVPVVGKTLTGAQQEIRQAAIERRVYRSPIVSVLLNTRKSDQVRVVGAVKEPGVKDLPRAGSDVLAALTAAGGLTEEAGYVIEVRHPARSADGRVLAASFDGEPPKGDPNAVRIDLVKAMEGDVGDLSLHDGSVVMVKKYIPETVYIHGLVKQAGEYELPKDKPLRVTQAVALASGREIEFADKVHVTRFVENQREPIVIEVSMEEAKSNSAANVVLMAGDVVSVEETPTTFTVDFLRNFFRIGFSSAIPGF